MSVKDEKKQSKRAAGEAPDKRETAEDQREAARDNAAPDTDPAADNAGAEDAAAEGGEAEAAGETSAEDANTQYMRLAADFQNYKKRTEKERFERYSEGKKDLAADILPVLDNLERAVSDEMKQDAAIAEGLEMISRQLREALAKNGVHEIEALGAEFDPNLHHAVMMEASDAFESGAVCEVLQKGYAIGEKVIRPAMVKVSQ
ncbi:MAG: nucleotide exchange factor GrpE [Clostridiales Family XIII bacterium]|jgi:molecular chaperone GrpE|nr:nucleotide exchange factor GrpE [Clostridiales Family XIII bacterium]